MRHLWVIEERAPGKNWHMVPCWTLTVADTKREAKDELRELKCERSGNIELRITKYVPEAKK